MTQSVEAQPAEKQPSAGEELALILRHMVQQQASDLFMTVGALPTVKVEGHMVPLGTAPLPPGSVQRFAYAIMSARQVESFEKDLECDLALTLRGLGRFRFNVYWQRGEVSMVARYVRSRIPSISALSLPPVLEKLAMLRHGLVLVVGSAGSGKSTTLAAMLDYRNQHSEGHILTVEDPVEFMHEHKRCIIDQREVGVDTHSFSDALRHAMREAPDVIMIGEIRDENTMRHALHYAESGHLCVSTLHANNADQAIERIVNFFPESARKQVLGELAMNLKGVVALRLIEGMQGRRVPATEVMLLSGYVSELIQKGEIGGIKSVIAKSSEMGMQSFDQSLYGLFQRGAISVEQALEHADSKTDLSLRIRLSAGLPTDAQGAAPVRQRRSA